MDKALEMLQQAPPAARLHTPRRDLAHVETALRWGVRAASEGVAMPLFALLDAAVLATAVERGLDTGIDAARADGYADGYQEWLDRLTAAAHGLFSGRATPASSPASTVADAVMRLAVSSWRFRGPAERTLGGTQSAYQRALARTDVRQRLLDAWQRSPSPSADPMVPWPELRAPSAGGAIREPDADPGALLPGAVPMAAAPAMWSLFAAGGSGLDPATHFDHAACAAYLSTPPWRPGSERRQRLSDQRREVMELMALPLATSYEELTRPFGHFTLHTVVMGDYGDYLLANHADLKIYEPPPQKPPDPVFVHVCWVYGYGAMQAAGSGPGDQVALLKAVLGTLLDDWRDAFSGLNVRFTVRREFPAPEISPPVRPGPAWGSAARRAVAPVGIVSQLFRRHTLVDVAASVEDASLLPWRQASGGGRDPARDDHGPRDRKHWYVGLVLDADLPGAGFDRSLWAAEDQGTPPPRAAANAVPARLSHLIVLDGANDRGGVCQIERGDKQVLLRPLPPVRRFVPPHDGFMAALRCDALDLAAQQIEERLR